MEQKEERQKLFVLVGPTRSGKSTFINTIMGRYVAVEGAERNYFSTTTEIANYSNLAMNLDHLQKVFKTEDSNTNDLTLNFIDTIGFGDVKVTFTDEEI